MKLLAQTGRIAALWFALALLCSQLALHAHAQSSEEPVVIVHQPPAAERLPFPGQPLPLELSLQGTKAFTDPLRILASIDGKLIDSRAEKSTISEQDIPKYQVQVHSPIAHMSYQFLLYRKDGSVITSPRYTIQRACIPSVSPAELTDASGQTGDERVSRLEVEAKALERDGQGYRRALKLLEELQQHLKEQGQ